MPLLNFEGSMFKVTCDAKIFEKTIFIFLTKLHFFRVKFVRHTLPWWAGQYTVLHFWTYIHKVLTNCSYSGIISLLCSERQQLILLTDTARKYMETIIWVRNVVSCIYCCYFYCFKFLFISRPDVYFTALGSFFYWGIY